MSYIIGIDEAGRGPLAGPVAVGAVRIKVGFDQDFFIGIKDSKKLIEAKRGEWFLKLDEARKKGEIDYAVILVSEKTIDKEGLSFAIKQGIDKCLTKLKAENSDQIYLDGGLKAPKQFLNQETIIKGDEKVPTIALASIAAKVIRDKYMTEQSAIYPEYKFEKHKGYGTALHIELIKKHGPSKLHRMSFLKNVVK